VEAKWKRGTEPGAVLRVCERAEAGQLCRFGEGKFGREVATHLEAGHGHDLLDAYFQHLHDLSREAANPDETVRALLGVGADEEEGSIVLCRPEGEGRRVLKGADNVGFGKGNRVRLLELVLQDNAQSQAKKVRFLVKVSSGGRSRSKAL
jgi:hypothetical protein